MNYLKLSIGLLVLAVILANTATLINQHKRNLLNKQYETMQVCSAAQKSGNFSVCYDAQRLLNTEFLCNSNNLACWVEVK